MRSLKDRYENFLQEEQRRLARNDKLLQTMEDIDYRASTLAAKTERLKLLKVSIIKISHLVGFLFILKPVSYVPFLPPKTPRLHLLLIPLSSPVEFARIHESHSGEEHVQLLMAIALDNIRVPPTISSNSEDDMDIQCIGV